MTLFNKGYDITIDRYCHRLSRIFGTMHPYLQPSGGFLVNLQPTFPYFPLFAFRVFVRICAPFSARLHELQLPLQ